MTHLLAVLGLALLALALPIQARTSVSINCGLGSYVPLITAGCDNKSVDDPTAPVGASRVVDLPAFKASVHAQGRADHGNLGAQSSYQLERAANNLNFHNANIVAGWDDVITPISGSLADGTPLVLRLVTEITATLDGNLGANQLGSLTVLSRLGGLAQGSCLRLWTPLHDCVQALPGQPVTLRHELSFNGAIGAAVAVTVSSIVAQQTGYVPVGSFVSVDSWSSARTSIQADTADVRLLAASGHDYSPTPVPEPTVAWLMLAGLCGLCAVLGRRRLVQAQRPVRRGHGSA